MLSFVTHLFEKSVSCFKIGECLKTLAFELNGLLNAFTCIFMNLNT